MAADSVGWLRWRLGVGPTGLGSCQVGRLAGRGELRGGESPACSPPAMGWLGIDRALVYGVAEVTAKLLVAVGWSGDGRRRSDG